MASGPSEARERPSERESSATVRDRSFAIAMSVAIVTMLPLVLARLCCSDGLIQLCPV